MGFNRQFRPYYELVTEYQNGEPITKVNDHLGSGGLDEDIAKTLKQEARRMHKKFVRLNSWNDSIKITTTLDFILDGFEYSTKVIMK